MMNIAVGKKSGMKSAGEYTGRKLFFPCWGFSGTGVQPAECHVPPSPWPNCVTCNMREFERVEALRIENYVSPRKVID